MDLWGQKLIKYPVLSYGNIRIENINIGKQKLSKTIKGYI